VNDKKPVGKKSSL